MALDPRSLPPEMLAFVRERHLASLTTLRPDSSPHVAPVGFTFEPETALARVITFGSSRKVRNLCAAGSARAALCQVDGGRWLTLEGMAVVTEDPLRVAEAVRRYAERYRQPGPRADRVSVEITVDRVLGRVAPVRASGRTRPSG